jgi:multiple sugar transport system permease protein
MLTSPSGRGLRIVANLLMIAIGILFAAPMTWLVLASVSRSATLSVGVDGLTWDNFSQVLTWRLSGLPLFNSLVLSLGSAVVTVAAALLAAYPLSRYRSRFNKPFLYTILFATGLPITAMMVPVYSLFVRFGLIDTIGGTLLFLAASQLPMAIWMTKNFVDRVPISLEEAAWIDGASGLRTLWSVVIPLMRPGIAVVFIYVFLHAWGNFFIPFILLMSPQYQPAAVSIYSFFGENGAIAYGQLAAYSVVYSVPVLVMYAIVSRSLGGSSALAGGLKG